MLTTKDGPGFLTTPKGSIKEWEILEAYALQIKDAYATLESRGALVDLPETWSGSTVTFYIREVVTKALGYRIVDDADFFNAGRNSFIFPGSSILPSSIGMDSLQVTILRSG